MLRYEKTINFNNTGVNHANIRFTPSWLYDIDPTVGSTSMAGFVELTAIYRYYRFRKCKYTIDAASDDTSPSLLTACPVNFDPGANTANYQNYLSARRAKQVMITAATPKKLIGEFTIADFGGVMECLIPDAYSGTGTTTPANNIWLFVGNTFPSGTMTNGISARIQLDVEADYFELAQPATFFRGSNGIYAPDPTKPQTNAMACRVNSIMYASETADSESDEELGEQEGKDLGQGEEKVHQPAEKQKNLPKTAPEESCEITCNKCSHKRL